MRLTKGQAVRTCDGFVASVFAVNEEKGFVDVLLDDGTHELYALDAVTDDVEEDREQERRA